MRSDDWQPMDTAPKNAYGEFYGPMIMVWCSADDRPWPAQYCLGTDGEPCWCIPNDHAAKPEHNEISERDVIAWMPIAKPWAVLEGDRK